MNTLTDMTPPIARFNMVEQQIRPWQVLNTHVLNLLSQLDRELFVPQAFKSLAYSDTELPLAAAEALLTGGDEE